MLLKKFINFFSTIKYKPIVFIFLLVVILTITTFIILKHNQFYTYLNEDVACILDMSKSFITEYEFINDITNTNFIKAINLLKTYWKPPILFVVSAPLLLLINNINIFLSILNLFLSFITLLSVYGIVKNIYSEKAGLFACFILSFCPIFFVMHRTFFIETILMTSICIVLYIITKNKFDNIYWNILFTLSLTFALLTKEQIVIYYPVFILFIIANKNNYTDIKRVLNIVLSFLFSYIFAYLLWYQYNAPNIFTHLLNFAKDKISNDYLYYLKSLYFFDLSSIIFILFIISIIYLLLKKKYLHIIISFVFILFVFSLSTNRVSRHIFPLIIFCPILISLFIFQIKNNFVRNCLIFIISFILFFQFILINFFDFKYFSSDKYKFFNYNYFKGITYYKYKSKIETYKEQYDYLVNILGKDFEENTIFINFFPPIAYNFLTLQKSRKNKTCKIVTFDDINIIKKDLKLYKNIVISSNNEPAYNELKDVLAGNDFEYVSVINIFNHTTAKTFLYKKK